MKYGSVCSGIEAATQAWHPLGWAPQWFSEIERFPSEVLSFRYPEVPNLGDMTKLHQTDIFNATTIDLLVGGTPCQSFSIAGLRKGLEDPRGNLMLTYLRLLDLKRPRWMVWENVPGVLSSNNGRDFGTFLGGLAELGYGFAYRVLDAQYFGVAQRRRRVFVVGYFGDWRPAASVLFEPYGLSGHSAPSRKKGEGAAGGIEGSAGSGQQIAMATGQANAETRTDGGATALTCNHEEPIVATLGHTQSNGLGIYQTETANTLEATSSVNQAVAFGVGERPDVAHCLRSNASKADKHESTTYVAASFKHSTGSKAHGIGYAQEQAPTLGTDASCNSVQLGTAIRRLTPIECERLQGFPDDWTKIPYKGKPIDQCPDGPRYKACGNSMAVPVMRWIGERIDAIDKIIQS